MCDLTICIERYNKNVVSQLYFDQEFQYDDQSCLPLSYRSSSSFVLTIKWCRPLSGKVCQVLQFSSAFISFSLSSVGGRAPEIRGQVISSSETCTLAKLYFTRWAVTTEELTHADSDSSLEFSLGLCPIVKVENFIQNWVFGHFFTNRLSISVPTFSTRWSTQGYHRRFRPSFTNWALLWFL